MDMLCGTHDQALAASIQDAMTCCQILQSCRHFWKSYGFPYKDTIVRSREARMDVSMLSEAEDANVPNRNRSCQSKHVIRQSYARDVAQIHLNGEQQ